jgi:hypothetical protein
VKRNLRRHAKSTLCPQSFPRICGRRVDNFCNVFHKAQCERGWEFQWLPITQIEVIPGGPSARSNFDLTYCFQARAQRYKRHKKVIMGVESLKCRPFLSRLVKKGWKVGQINFTQVGHHSFNEGNSKKTQYIYIQFARIEIKEKYRCTTHII